VSTGMDESDVVWQLVFCFKKEFFWKVVLKRSGGWAVSYGGREVQWLLLKIKTSGKMLRYLDCLVQGILFYIEKLPAPFGEDALCKIQNIFSKQPCIK
jgi:hypothetical protein